MHKLLICPLFVAGLLAPVAAGATETQDVERVPVFALAGVPTVALDEPEAAFGEARLPIRAIGKVVKTNLPTLTKVVPVAVKVTKVAVLPYTIVNGAAQFGWYVGNKTTGGMAGAYPGLRAAVTGR